MNKTSPAVRRLLLWGALLSSAMLLAWMGWPRGSRTNPSLPPQQAGSVPLAVIGDSDSHSYQDRRSFPLGSAERGGPHRETTLQWTEILGSLRSQSVDLGEWGVYGTPRVIARVARSVGITLRSPRKEDYLYNFAVSGRGCSDLLGGPTRQVPALLALMDEHPGRWRNGVVVIRIGVNDFGDAPVLDQLAQDPMSPAAQQKMTDCIHAIRESVAALHARHPDLRIVLVGIFDNAHWSKNLDRWHSRVAIDNISTGLDVFDRALSGMEKADRRIAFFNDRAWFQQHWGGRDAQGKPAYREVRLGRMRVTNTAGDEPSNATVADGHAGTVWNALWAQAMVELLNTRFDMRIAPITDAEMIAIVEGKPLPKPQ